MPRPKNHILLDMFKKTNNEYRSICNNGKCRGKILSAHSANLERHLKTAHPALYTRYLKEKGAITSKPKVELTPQQPSTQTLINEIKSNRANIELAIVEFFTKSGRPWSMLDDRAFKVLVQPAFDAIGIKANEENIRYLILGHSEKWKMQTITELKGKLLSLKIDAFSRPYATVFATSVQYVEHKIVQMKTLAVTDLTDVQHTCEHLEAIVLQVLREYEIDINQIFTITTDSEVHLTKSIENQWPSEFEMTVEDGGDGGDGGDIIYANGRYDCRLMDVTMEMLMLRFSSDMVTGVRCGARILQLCIQDVIDSPEIHGKLEKYKMLLATVTNENEIEPAFAESWTYRFNELESLLEANTIGSTECGEWWFLNQYVTILKPIHTAIKRLRSEQLCLSDLYIIIMDLLFQIENQPSGELKRLVVMALTERKDELFNLDMCNAAIYLDPRIKICLNSVQMARAKYYITSLYQRMNSVRDNKNKSKIKHKIKEESSDGTLVTQQCSNAKSFSEFLNNLDTSRTEPTSPCLSAELDSDFKMYDSQPRLPLDLNLAKHWFVQNNCLSVIAEMLLAVPTTQASMERLATAITRLSSEQSQPCAFDFNTELNLIMNMNGGFIYEN